MKVKKARKRLRRVEDLLTTVIEKYGGAHRNVQELLDAAKTAVTGALTSLPRSENGKKPPARASKANTLPARTARKSAAAGHASKAGQGS